MSIKSNIVAVLSWLQGKTAPAVAPVQPAVAGPVPVWLNPKEALEKVTALYHTAIEQADSSLSVLASQRDSHLQSIAQLHAQVTEHDSHIVELQAVKDQVVSALNPVKYASEAPVAPGVTGIPL